MFNFDTKSKAGLSLGKTQTVCGYKIKKLPLGKYVRAAEKLQTLPADFLAQCFPGKSLQEVVDELTKADENSLTQLVMSALAVVPGYVFSLVSELSGIPEDELENNSDIGAEGFVQIIRAVIEVNRLGEAAKIIKEMIAAAIPTAGTGSSG